MAAKLTRPTHKIEIQLPLMAENCTIWGSSRSRRSIRKLLDTPSYIYAPRGMGTRDSNVRTSRNHKHHEERGHCGRRFMIILTNICQAATCFIQKYEGVSKSFRTGSLERELQMVQLSATKCSCITILWVSLVSFAAITLCFAPQRVIPKVSVYFVIDWVRKLLDTQSYDDFVGEF
jgi:hypothetical protein